MTNAHRKRAEQIVADLIAVKWPEARIDSVTPIEGDASARSYLRCTIVEPAPNTGAPPSVVVMVAEGPSVAMSSTEIGPFAGQTPDESPFINVGRFLAPLTDAVPTILKSNSDGTVIVVEDVGDLSLWQAAKRPGADVEGLFGRALETLVSIQSRTASAPAQKRRDCHAFGHRFDERLFAWELDHFIDYGLSWPGQDELEACRLELGALARRLAAMPLAFCHRDYHAWNIHVQGSRLRVFDFQDALVGPAMYDVASLLTDRTTPLIIDRGMETRLVTLFHSFIGKAGGTSKEAALEDYRSLALHRALKVIGRFNYLAEEKGKLSYLSILPTVVATARRFIAEAGDFPVTSGLLETRVKAGRTFEPSL